MIVEDKAIPDDAQIAINYNALFVFLMVTI